MSPTTGYSCQTNLDTIIITSAVVPKSSNGRTGYGIIAKYWRGKTLAIWTKMTDKHTADAEAIRFALIQARVEGWNTVGVHGN